MSKLVALPLLFAGAIGLYFAVPGLLTPDQHSPTFSYWLAAPSVACTGIALCVLSGIITLSRKSMTIRPIPSTNEFLLLPRLLRKERIGNVIALFFTVALPMALLALHLELTRRPVPPEGHLFAATAALLFLVQAFQILRRTRSLRFHSDLRLILASDLIRLDDPFTLRIEIDAIKPLPVAECRIRILCFEHVLLHSGRYVHHVIRQRNEIVLPLAGQTVIPAGQTFSGSAQQVIDSIRYPPSGPWAVSMYPYYRWEIHVELTGDSRYAAIFPLTVHRVPAPAT